MIEADIVYGYLLNDSAKVYQPVMGHPPNIESDIALESFLSQISSFNINSLKEKQKGVKLDFKSTDVYQKSLPILIKLWSMMDYDVWINADIYHGPLNNIETQPVDAKIFFDGTKSLPNATLSTGWTTRWGSNFTDGHYTDEQVTKMIDGIKENNVTNHMVTFPVRAGIAAQSLTQLDHLYKSVKDINPTTFTIWHSANDSVDVDKLRKVIFHFGIENVYVDVPEELSKQLRLHEPSLGITLKASFLIGLVSFFNMLKSMF